MATRTEKAQRVLSELTLPERIMRAKETTNVQEQHAFVRYIRNFENFDIRVALVQNIHLDAAVQKVILNKEKDLDVLEKLMNNPALVADAKHIANSAIPAILDISTLAVCVTSFDESCCTKATN